MQRGFAKIWRNIIEAPFYDDQKACRLAVHLLLKVNHKKAEVLIGGEVITIQPGQTLTSVKILQGETGLSTMSIRVALHHLEKCHFVTSETTNQYTMLTICKHGIYNNGEIKNNKQNNKPVTNQQQASNKPVTTNNKDKNDKNEKNEKKRPEERKKKRKPSSFFDLEKSKDQIERDFYELFKNYPKLTNWEKGLEIFRADVAHPDALDKIKIALTRYLDKIKDTKEYPKTIYKFMTLWADFYAEHVRESKGKKTATVKQKEADIEAAAERKRIEKIKPLTPKETDDILRKTAPKIWANKQAKKKGG